MLGLIFALLIASALFEHYNPEKKSGDGGSAATQVQFRTALMMRSLENLPGGAASRSQIRDSIADTAKQMEPEAKRSEIDAFHVLILGRLAEAPASKAALANLQDSKDKALKAAGEFYADSELKPDRAKELAQSFGTKGEAWEMARAQARQQAGEIEDAGDALAPSDFGGIFAGFAALALAVMAGFILLPLGIILAATGKWKPRGWDRLAPTSADIAAGLAALYFLGYIIIPSAIIPLAGGLPPMTRNVAAFIPLVALAAIFGWWLGPKAGVRLNRPAGGWVQTAAGFFGMPANWPILLGLTALVAPFLNSGGPAPTHPLTDAAAGGAAPIEAISMLILAAVFAPFIEETIFRGLILTGLSSRLKSFWWANLIQAFLFAAIHPQGPLLWPMLGAIGFMAGVLVHRTGSLWPAILMHGLHNGLLVGLNLGLNS